MFDVNKVNDYQKKILKLDETSPNYIFNLKDITKNFLKELTKSDVAVYLRDYHFYSIIDESGNFIEDKKPEKNTQAFAYFLCFAAHKHKAKFVFEKLLPNSTVNITESKLNPINWIKWIFTQVVWSEIKANPELKKDKSFFQAVEKFNSLSKDDLKKINLFRDKEWSNALYTVINTVAKNYEPAYKLKKPAELSISTVTTPTASLASEKGNALSSPSNVSAQVPPPPPPPPPPSSPKDDVSLKQSSLQNTPLSGAGSQLSAATPQNKPPLTQVQSVQNDGYLDELKSFFKKKGMGNYSEQLKSVGSIQQGATESKKDTSRSTVQTFSNSSNAFFKDKQESKIDTNDTTKRPPSNRR